MPTVLLQNGFRFMINTDDHEPMHTHVFYQGRTVLIEFAEDVKIVRNRRMAIRDVERAKQVVEENKEFFQIKWSEIHG
jgi:Domain of unknown function (DUF4160)